MRSEEGRPHLCREPPQHVSRSLVHALTLSCLKGSSQALRRAPAQPRLGTFKNEELKKHAIVVYGNAPFFVVVGDEQGIGP